MADIAMCPDKACPDRDDCYRATAIPRPKGQMMFADSPRDGVKCTYFWPNADRLNRNPKELEDLKSKRDDLLVQLDKAKADCVFYTPPAHMVRNCLAAMDNERQAWRRRQQLEYEIMQVEKMIDTDKTLDK